MHASLQQQQSRNTPETMFRVVVCDLSDAIAVGTMCDQLFGAQREGELLLSRLAVIVTNAGIMAVPAALSRQGLESQFATHHVGHSLLLLRFLNAKAQHIKETRSSSAISRRTERSGKKMIDRTRTRIVILGSGAAAGACADPRALLSLFRPLLNSLALVTSGYNRFTAYSNAKVCNILFSSALHAHIVERGLDEWVSVNCLHPGPIRSRVVPHSKLPLQWLLDGELAALLRLSPVIAATYVVDLCVHKRFDGISGRFFRMGVDMTAEYRHHRDIAALPLANTHWFRGIPAPRLTMDTVLQQAVLRETVKLHKALGLL
jgi:NAD(P)-dependent dehydrogenase (short-subunit alcohol dehydrogenase family)